MLSFALLLQDGDQRLFDIIRDMELRLELDAAIARHRAFDLDHVEQAVSPELEAASAAL